MAVNEDFRDLFAALNEAGARYLVVGGYALAFHGHPRYTKDLDVWVDPDGANAARVYRALAEFGAPLDDLTTEDLQRDSMVFQIGIAPNRIDVVTAIDGVSFAEAWPERVASDLGDQRIAVVGRDHLIRNKRSTRRPQDLLDAERLETPD